jgi:thioester reductase-like protein
MATLPMSQSVLLTGFPGFIGKLLVARLLKDDPSLRIVVLVEPRMVATATTAARALGENVIVEPGDITDAHLGLAAARYRELTETVSRVFHLAAIYDLAVPEAVAEAVNVMGTKHVLDFCGACDSLERHHYVSTAYVAGTRTDRVLESELDRGQAFKNHYESTKHRAEVLVRETMPSIRTTIYRPGIVVGDSQTGVTQKFDGPYYLLRFIALFSRLHLPPPQIASEEATFNAVPVDFIVDAIAAGVGDERFVGETLHLVDPAPVPAAELLRLLARAYSGKELRWRLPSGLVERALGVGMIRRLVAGTPRESVLYLNHPVTFDTTRAMALLVEHGLRCPGVPEYLDAIVQFFREHEHDPAMAPPKAE